MRRHPARPSSRPGPAPTLNPVQVARIRTESTQRGHEISELTDIGVKLSTERNYNTLLELILAMAMMSMLAVSLYGTLRVAFKARESATSGIAPMRSANVALDLIGEDLESALPPTGLLAGAFLAQHLGDVQNSQDTIEFYNGKNCADAK